MLKVSNSVVLAERELEWTAIRAQGPGGQHLNKVSTAVLLRFDTQGSSLPDSYKARLLQLTDSRIGRDGVILIKAQQHRSQVRNLEEARKRLLELLQQAGYSPKTRRPTKPTRGSQKRRLEAKNQRGKVKAGRGRVEF